MNENNRNNWEDQIVTFKQSHFLLYQGLLFLTRSTCVMVDARSHTCKSHDFIPRYDININTPLTKHNQMAALRRINLGYGGQGSCVVLSVIWLTDRVWAHNVDVWEMANVFNIDLRLELAIRHYDGLYMNRIVILNCTVQPCYVNLDARLSWSAEDVSMQ